MPNGINLKKPTDEKEGNNGFKIMTSVLFCVYCIAFQSQETLKIWNQMSPWNNTALLIIKDHRSDVVIRL